MGFLSRLFGVNKVNLQELLAVGAVIIDVRSPSEFARGNVKGSFNIPLDKLGTHISEIKNYAKPIIVCCASGVRSSSAKLILTKKGIENVHNGGSWSSLI